MSNDCHGLWPEDPTPRSLIDCSQCGLDKQGTRMVWGEGNPKAPILVLLDNPGAREDKEGKAFVCGTRQTLQKVAHEVGFSQQDLYITYVLKRKPVRTYDKEAVRRTCLNHLQQQLNDNAPKYILCLGNVAVQSFFDNPLAEVKSLRGSIHQLNHYQVAVAYHPLAVRRRPNLWSYFVEDWQLLANHYSREI